MTASTQPTRTRSLNSLRVGMNNYMKDVISKVQRINSGGGGDMVGM